MIARDIIISFYIYNLLTHDKIYSKIWSMILTVFDQ